MREQAEPPSDESSVTHNLFLIGKNRRGAWVVRDQRDCTADCSSHGKTRCAMRCSRTAAAAGRCHGPGGLELDLAA